MTRQEIIERLCLLASEVWNARFDAASSANDCFCQKGGFWDSPSYSDADFRNTGEALEWIEQTVRAALSSEVPPVSPSAASAGNPATDEQNNPTLSPEAEKGS